MAGIIDEIRNRTRHATSGGGILGGLGQNGGLLSGLTSGGGVLSNALGPLQSRLATLQGAGTLQTKVQALSGTLGTRLKTIGGGSMLGGASGSSPPAPSTDARYQVAGIARVYGNPSPPAGIQFR